MKKALLLLLLVLAGAGSAKAQKVALKHNFVWDALKTPNLSLEVAMGRKWTVDTHLGMNHFLYTTNPTASNYKTKKLSHWMLQPEARYWMCDVFNGWYIGAHAHGGIFNCGGISIPFVLQNKNHVMRYHRYEGHFYGGGISTGYQWVLSKRFNLEASLGVGYARIFYDKYKCTTCGQRLGNGNADYLGVTKAAVSVVYFFK